jgi:hypothetical protein
MGEAGIGLLGRSTGGSIGLGVEWRVIIATNAKNGKAGKERDS